MLKYSLQLLSLVLTYIGMGVITLNVLQLDAISATILSNIAIGALCFAFLMRADGKVLRLDKLRSTRLIIMLGLMLLPVWLFGQLGASWFYQHLGDSLFDTYTSNMQGGGFLVLGLIVAPVVEELLLRGMGYAYLRHKFNLKIGLVLICQSIVFALMHGTVLHLFSTILLGVLLGLSVEVSGRIYPAIILHFIYNALSVILSGLSLPSILFNPLVWGTGMVLCVWGLYQVYRNIIDVKKF